MCCVKGVGCDSSIPTEYDPKRSTTTAIGWKDPRHIAGELACPARYSRKEVEADKKARPRIFNAQHQQNPAADEGAIFPRNKWRYYREDPERYRQAHGGGYPVDGRRV